MKRRQVVTHARQGKVKPGDTRRQTTREVARPGRCGKGSQAGEYNNVGRQKK
jgi:hypothetical protein